MHRPVVTVGRNSRPVELLLIENVVLRAGLHTTFLHADNRLKHGDSRQIRIRREAFPVSSGLGDLFERLAQLLKKKKSLQSMDCSSAACQKKKSTHLPQRPRNRAQLHIHAQPLRFLAQRQPALVDELAVPRRGGLDAGGKGADVGRVPHAQRAVLQAQRRVADPGHGVRVADAGAVAPADAGDDVDLLGLVELGEGRGGLGVGGGPVDGGRVGCWLWTCQMICFGLFSLVFSRRKNYLLWALLSVMVPAATAAATASWPLILAS